MSEQIHKGHRERMRQKLIAHGSEVFETHELVEILLYYALPFKDTGDIARRLVQKFGNIEALFSASREELLEVPGVGEQICELIHTAAKIVLMPVLSSDKPVYDNFERLGAFFVKKLSHYKTYKTAAAFFDANMRMLAYEELYDLDYHSGAVNAAPFVDKALDYKASVVVSVHNHPHGPLFPTVGDMATNKLIRDSLASVSIELAEHYIVCGDKFVGAMNHLDMFVKQNPALKKFHESREACQKYE